MLLSCATQTYTENVSIDLRPTQNGSVWFGDLFVCVDSVVLDGHYGRAASGNEQDREAWEYENNEEFIPSILLFDWEGNALGEIKATFKVGCLEIDEKNNLIYILNEDDELIEYNLGT